jgi:type II secretory pathway pseudopilin PulG
MMSPARYPVELPKRGSEQGYVLLVLILFVALLAIAVTVTLPSIGFELKRDREEELIHRGVQYTRAIQHYVKKFGRYPTTLEQLENTNQVRFLRRRYKDPITGKDFKLLHMEDVQTSFGAGIAGATPVSQMALGGGFGGGPFSNAGPGIGGLGNQSFGGPGFGNQGILQPAQTGLNVNGPQPPGGFGQGGIAGTTNQASQSGDETGATGTFGGPNAPGGAGTNAGSGGFGASPSGSSSSNQAFGGGPIVGVASISKDKTIRVFNKKDRYYQWQFIYNPAMDRGGLLTGPGQPASLGVASSVGTPAGGAPGTGAQNPGGQGSGGFGGALGGGFGGQPSQPNPPVTQPPQMPPEQ